MSNVNFASVLPVWLNSKNIGMWQLRVIRRYLLLLLSIKNKEAFADSRREAQL